MYIYLLDNLLNQNVRFHAHIFHFLQTNQIYCMFKICKKIVKEQIVFFKGSLNVNHIIIEDVILKNQHEA